MSGRPNPWITIPALAMGILAAALGWVVTDVSCREPDASGVVVGCTGWAVVIALVSFLVVTVGVALMLVLVYRSLAEWREGQSRRS